MLFRPAKIKTNCINYNTTSLYLARAKSLTLNKAHLLKFYLVIYLHKYALKLK